MTTETWKADADGRCHAGCQAYCIKEGGPSWCGVEGTPTRSGRLCIPAAIVAPFAARLSAVEAAVHGGPVTPPETHEARWLRLGWEVQWNEETRDYEICLIGDIFVAARRPTVQAVDEWIAAQAPAAKARAEYGNDNDDASVDIAAAEHRTQQAERERDAALASLARVRGVLAEVLGARISLGSPSFYADGSTINERDERCAIARCLLPDLRERAEKESKGGTGT